MNSDDYVKWLRETLVPSLGLRGGSGRLNGWEVGGFTSRVKLGFVALQDKTMRVQLHDHDGAFAQSWPRIAVTERVRGPRQVLGVPLVCETGTRAKLELYLRFSWERNCADDFEPELAKVEAAAQWLVSFASKTGLLTLEPLRARRAPARRAWSHREMEAQRGI